MEFTQFYIVLLRKGPTWSPEVTPQVEATQEKHLAHLASLTESGVLLLAGPTQVHSDNDLRGIGIYRYDAFETLDELKAHVERDPAIQNGRLRAEYVTWHTAKGSVVGYREEPSSVSS